MPSHGAPVREPESTSEHEPERRGVIVRFLGGIERIGNLLPHLIITDMLGVAVAEGSGLISAAIRVAVSRVSRSWLTFTVALVGVTGSVASDAIYIILIPLAAAAFKAVGRSAALGAIVAFGSASAGYNASLLITASDPRFAGISTAAVQLIEEDYVVSPIANYFFAAASAVVLAVVVTLVTELLLVKMTERMRKEEDAAGGAATAVLAAGRPAQVADAQDSVHKTGTATGGTAEGTAGEGGATSADQRGGAAELFRAGGARPTSPWRWDISSVTTRKPVWEPCSR